MISRLFALCCFALALGARLWADPKQFADGRIAFDSESATKSGNSLEWHYRPTRWGTYDIVLTRSDHGNAPLEIEIAGQKFTATAQPRFGRFHLPKADPFAISIRSQNSPDAPALMSLLLEPAPEGQEIVQSTDVIPLRAHDATTHSVMLRYEPATNKNCLGYWVNPSDTAEWHFAATKPGDYQIELWQGCGKSQGGSDVAVELRDNSGALLHTAQVVVEDSGHFQNFVPRDLGRIHIPAAGTYALWIKPQSKKAGAIMDVRQVILTRIEPAGNRLKSLSESKRIVFLGDSITYSGEYVEFVETYFHLQYPAASVEFINLGLPSETVSGLTEPGHAGGSFPRPDLHERLARALEKIKPDLIFACYGMNDGIYSPFSEERFARFQEGIRFMREKAEAAGARIVHLTPPTFDPVPLKGRTLPAGLPEYRAPYEGYNEVLDRYSEWLAQQRAAGWEVIDVHSAMNRFLAEQRRTKASFILAGDGVHANAQGHWIIAREILDYLDAPKELTSSDNPAALTALRPNASKILALVQQKERLLKDSWLTTVGHLRPGMNKGEPLAKAEAQATKLNEQIRQNAAE